MLGAKVYAWILPKKHGYFRYFPYMIKVVLFVAVQSTLRVLDCETAQNLIVYFKMFICSKKCGSLHNTFEHIPANCISVYFWLNPPKCFNICNANMVQWHQRTMVYQNSVHNVLSWSAACTSYSNQALLYAENSLCIILSSSKCVQV